MWSECMCTVKDNRPTQMGVGEGGLSYNSEVAY